MSVSYLQAAYLAKNVLCNVPGFVKEVRLYRQGIIFEMQPGVDQLLLLRYLRLHCVIKAMALMDLYAVDYPEREKRFEINYHLTSLALNYHFILKSSIQELDRVESVTPEFSSALWFEREVFEMFGIYFINHADLRRLLTDYGFQGHPLRKDFPLSGYLEIAYDVSSKRLTLELVKFPQEYRVFDFESPWDKEGIK